jgi:hypothetical protein
VPVCYKPQAVGKVEAGRAKINIRLMKNLDMTTCICQSKEKTAIRKPCRMSSWYRIHGE